MQVTVFNTLLIIINTIYLLKHQDRQQALKIQMNQLKKIFSVSFLLFISLLELGFAQEMVKIRGKQIEIGSKEGFEDEQPTFQTILKTFLLDTNPVTVGQFRLFARLNRYITEAEKKGIGYIYDAEASEWKAIEGANWKYPQGPAAPPAQLNEPVRQISWVDAQAYAVWIGKRLPNEFELEYAAKHANELGINQLDGSLWHWCENWYQRYDASEYYTSNLNRKKTLKAGTAHQQATFRASLRNAALPTQVSYDFGFRCAKDID